MTYGNIWEGDRDKFFENKPKPAWPSPPPPPTYVCPYCSERLTNFRMLNAHLQASHTNPRPFLLLNGREPGDGDAIRHPLGRHDLNLVGAATVEAAVDRGPFRNLDGAGLSRLLSAHGCRSLDIRLANGSAWGPAAGESYRLKVRIASDAELRKADEAFVRLFGQGEAHLLTLDRLKAEAGAGPVDDYVGALCNYVHGVLMKDFAPGTGIRPPRTDWTESYKAALQVLAKTPRPLAILLCGVMRFALNDFSARRTATGFPLLDEAFRTLGPMTEGHAPARGRRTRTGRGRINVCPLDAGVYRVMEENHRLASLRRWSAIDEAAIRDLASSETLGPLDRAKAVAVWALAALRLGAHGAASEPLRRLLNNHCFGAWAAARLAEIDS